MIAGADVGAVEGLDGWLFLRRVGDIDTLQGFSDLGEWRRRVLPGFVANFASRARRMAARGIPFVVVLAPEATGIYPDMLPEDAGPIETPTMAEHLAGALAEEGIKVVCPAARLRAARGPIDVYQRLDSHWSAFGAFLCYREILEQLSIEGPCWRDIRYSVRNGFGDLSIHVIPERSGAVHDTEIPAISATAGANIFDNRARNVRRHQCEAGVGRALVIRDSFASALTPFLERTFAETILVGGSPAMPDDAIDHFAPDIVILEMAERSLLVPQDPFADWPAASFEQLHYEKATNPIGGQWQCQARTALEGNKPIEAMAAASVAIALEGADGRFHNLAHALLMAGHGNPTLLKVGDELCARTAPQRDDRYLHWLHSQFAYMRGRETEARIALKRALERQPSHAQYLYSLAVWDHLAGDHASALAVMLRSLEGAPLHADSWRIAILSARATDPSVIGTLIADAKRVLPDLDIV